MSGRRKPWQGLAGQLLSSLGRWLPRRFFFASELVLNYLAVGHWMRRRGFAPVAQKRDRVDHFRAVAAGMADQPVAYLEFGVREGESLRLWAELLAHSESELHGFDSFEGLPEDWGLHQPKGAFDQGGRAPVFEDPRVVLHQGWFEQTLPEFKVPTDKRLVVHCDADLYSSTKIVLDSLGKHFRAGTILMFDEFPVREHELKAFDEYLLAHPAELRILSATRGFAQVAFEFL
ncbi:MAG: class I SAM-dependent methyltransferase [Vulcanimicrobiota bacterium]